MKKQPPTFERHQDIGTRLKDTYDFLIGIQVELSGSYNITSKTHKAICRTIDSLNHLRSELDSMVFMENRNKDTQELISVYYGNRSYTPKGELL